MYTMTDFEKQFNIAKEQLSNINNGEYNYINNYVYTLEFMKGAINLLGRCAKVSDNEFIISINKIYADCASSKDINDTIMHELCHSIKGGMKHTGEWKKVVNIVNNIYGYSIKRTTYSKEYTEIRCELKPYKYEIYCDNCGYSWKYIKMSAAVKSVQAGSSSYYCSKCNKRHTLKVRTLDNSKTLCTNC